MNNVTSFNVTYDHDSDVLYLSRHAGSAERGVQDKYGFVWRYDREGELIGVTVVDFMDFWHANKQVLVREISEHFLIPEAYACIVLDSVSDGGHSH
jgi:uncharacterized protein YuzE